MEEQGGMSSPISSMGRVSGRLVGMFIDNALAIPGHWYDNSLALIKNLQTKKEIG